MQNKNVLLLLNENVHFLSFNFANLVVGLILSDDTGNTIDVKRSRSYYY